MLSSSRGLGPWWALRRDAHTAITTKNGGKKNFAEARIRNRSRKILDSNPVVKSPAHFMASKSATPLYPTGAGRRDGTAKAIKMRILQETLDPRQVVIRAPIRADKGGLLGNWGRSAPRLPLRWLPRWTRMGNQTVPGKAPAAPIRRVASG